MPQNNDELRYITINDFKPGISDDPGANYPPGSAQRDNTFRCIANRQGALTPLPVRTIPFSMPADGTPSPDTRYAIDGLYAPPISMLPTVLHFNTDLFPEHELMVGNEWLQGGNLNQKLRRVRRYETPGTAMDTIMSVSAAVADTTLTPSGMGFGTTRSNRVTPTSASTWVPVVICMYVNGFLFNYVAEFPDDQAPTTNTPYVIFTNTAFFLGLACHQGRTVAQQATSYGQGVNTDTFMGENIVFSAPADVTNTNWNLATPQVFVPENPSGFAFLAPMSANELFAVKLYGGLYVTGDLADPFVTSLPMVTGSEVQQTPVTTTTGVIYGNGSTGIWMWSHGDTSQLLSPALRPNFWLLHVPEDNEFDVFGGVRYQFARCDDWVFVSNNWLYDMTLQSWWRFEDPDVVQIRYWTVMARFIYGAEGFYDNNNLNPISMWERSVNATTNLSLNYSWQSQPLWETIGNYIDVREITLRAKGQGSVTVTLTGETSTATVQFQVDNAFPVLLRQPVRLQDANVSVTMVADSDTIAPTIYECNIGIFTAQRATQLQ